MPLFLKLAVFYEFRHTLVPWLARQRAFWLAVSVLCQSPVTKLISSQSTRDTTRVSPYYPHLLMRNINFTLTILASINNMDSLNKECTPLKAKYDDCFNVWFRDNFLKGKADFGHELACGELFKAYQSCLQVYNIFAKSIYFSVNHDKNPFHRKRSRSIRYLRKSCTQTS